MLNGYDMFLNFCYFFVIMSLDLSKLSMVTLYTITCNSFEW